MTRGAERLDSGPLSDEELDELDQFLLDAEGIDESMGVSTLDGFLTAIVAGPVAVMPSQWLPWVWDQERGQDSPLWHDVAEASRIYSLVMRHMNDIAQVLRDVPDQYEPLIMENVSGPEPVAVIDEWCFGFMKGISLTPEAWKPLLDTHPEWFETLSLYGTWEGFERLQQLDLSLAEHHRRAGALASTVQQIYQDGIARRTERRQRSRNEEVQHRQPFRKEAKIGRNAPCPCGSGRKYKQCHGASVLH